MEKKIRVLMVCHGNICRSPMAEYIFKKLINDAGRESDFQVDSAATSREEIGNDIYPPAKEQLRMHSVPFFHHAARQVTEEDMRQNDLIIIMDSRNKSYIERLFGTEYNQKVHLLMEYAGENRDVTDPWYSGKFSIAYEDILAGCKGLLDYYD